MNLYHEYIRFNDTCSIVDRFTNKALSRRGLSYSSFKAYTAYAVIKLHDAWAIRCREIVVKSSSGSHFTLSGSSLARSPVLSKGEDPMHWLRNNWSKKGKMFPKWEPKWHIPDEAINAANLLKIQNLTIFTNALGALTVVDELRYTRNAIVHSLPTAYIDFHKIVMRRGGYRKVNPFDFVYFRPAGSMQMLIDDWMSQLKLCLKLAVK